MSTVESRGGAGNRAAWAVTMAYSCALYVCRVRHLEQFRIIIMSAHTHTQYIHSPSDRERLHSWRNHKPDCLWWSVLGWAEKGYAHGGGVLTSLSLFFLSLSLSAFRSPLSTLLHTCQLCPSPARKSMSPSCAGLMMDAPDQGCPHQGRPSATKPVRLSSPLYARKRGQRPQSLLHPA